MSPNADTRRRFLVVRKIEDGSEVHRSEVTGRTDNEIAKIESGRLRQMNKEEYFLGDEDEKGKPWRTR